LEVLLEVEVHGASGRGMHGEGRPDPELLEEVPFLDGVFLALLDDGEDESQVDPVRPGLQEVMLGGRVVGLAVAIMVNDEAVDLDQPGPPRARRSGGS